jgi:type IV secretory pathway TrbD component
MAERVARGVQHILRKKYNDLRQRLKGSVMQQSHHIEGYAAPIHRALWERILTLGAPRLWAALWLVSCLYVALLFLTIIGFRWVLLPLVVWAVGQGLLVCLTQWEIHWDDVAIAQLTRRYKALYEAG